ARARRGPAMTERDRALAEIAAIAERHGLTQEEILRALDARSSGAGAAGVTDAAGFAGAAAAAGVAGAAGVGGVARGSGVAGAAEVPGASRGPEGSEDAAVSSRTGALGRAFAYLGGTFVLAGLGVLVSTFWDGM